MGYLAVLLLGVTIGYLANMDEFQHWVENTVIYKIDSIRFRQRRRNLILRKRPN